MFTADEEKVARILAVARSADGSVDPEAPITMSVDGESTTFDVGWHGYVPTAQQIIAALA